MANESIRSATVHEHEQHATAAVSRTTATATAAAAAATVPDNGSLHATPKSNQHGKGGIPNSLPHDSRTTKSN